MEIKVGSYRVRKSGERGLVVQVPRVWADDVGVKRKDRVTMIRDEKGRLIIEKALVQDKEA